MRRLVVRRLLLRPLAVPLAELRRQVEQFIILAEVLRQQPRITQDIRDTVRIVVRVRGGLPRVGRPSAQPRPALRYRPRLVPLARPLVRPLTKAAKLAEVLQQTTEAIEQEVLARPVIVVELNADKLHICLVRLVVARQVLVTPLLVAARLRPVAVRRPLSFL